MYGSNMLYLHGLLGGGGSKKNERELRKRIAHLTSVADISDRVSGNTDVFYDTFDGTNELSIGKVDSTVYNITNWTESNPDTVTVSNYKGELSVGQEVTIVSLNGKYLHRCVIQDIEIASENAVIVLDSIPHHSGECILCRSMLTWSEKGYSLYPYGCSEYDVRMDIESTENIGSLVSWVEYEDNTNLGSSYTIEMTSEDTEDIEIETLHNVSAERVNGGYTVRVSWDSPQDIRISSIVICRTSTHYVDTPTNILTEIKDLNIAEYIDRTASNQEYYYTLFAIDDSTGRYSKATTHTGVDDVPPTIPGDIRVGMTPNPNNMYLVDILIEWSKPLDLDLKTLEMIVDEEVVYAGLDNTSVTVTKGIDTEVSMTLRCTDEWENVSQKHKTITTTGKPYPVYGVRVNESTGLIEHIEDAVGMPVGQSTGIGSWSQVYPFSLIRPCNIEQNANSNHGKVLFYIDPNDFTKKVDGTSFGNSGTEGQTMIEFPKVYFKMDRISESEYEIRMCQAKATPEYTCPAHTVGSSERDKIYIGAYLTNTYGGQAFSNRGLTPHVSATLERFRGQAQGWGEGWQVMSFHAYTMLQVLYLIIYRSLDSQSCLGKGICSGGIQNTGTLLTSGTTFGNTSSTTVRVKFLGIEDFYGNAHQMIDGAVIKTDNSLWVNRNDVFNSTGEGYQNTGMVVDSPTGNANFNSILGSSLSTGFIASSVVGTSGMYPDKFNQSVNVLRTPSFGGTNSFGSDTGVFSQTMVGNNASMSSGSSRLMYLGK